MVISGLTSKLWLFRQGLQKDKEDDRTNSFLNVIDNVLLKSRKLPTLILLENVKGFEHSETKAQFVNALNRLDYEYREFLISPTQLGVPNSRLRYYLIARLKSDDETRFSFTGDAIHDRLPQFDFNCDQCTVRFAKSEDIKPIKHYVEDLDEEQFEKYRVSDKVLDRYSFVFDIVTESKLNSCCFTRSYASMVQGTGSVLQVNSELDTKAVFDCLPRYEVDPSPEGSDLRINSLKPLRLRYFTPREVANLMCFPERFKLCPELTDKQHYKLLGNSINVKVVSEMMKLLLFA